MSILRALYILPLFIFLSMSMASASNGRNLLIQNELNCIDAHPSQGSTISWDDVCYVPESSYQQHMDIVNRQLDQAQEPAFQEKAIVYSRNNLNPTEPQRQPAVHKRKAASAPAQL